jgi:glycosyltransferase involved in cell wall biosynthesis
MSKLSVTIITLNEEKFIGQCLDAAWKVADEIIVVDSYSTDRTEEIVRAKNAQFYQNKFSGYRDQKNYAQSLTTYDYVLSLDADEILSDELIEEINQHKQAFDSNGYNLKRITNYNGQWIKHCGWYPDEKIRLIKKSEGQWAGENIHEIMEVNGPTKTFRGDLLHYSYDSISSHILQTDKFSTYEAQSHFSRGKKASLLRLITRPIWQFVKDYFFKRGFLDGKYGFIICSINALYVLLRYAKMYDLENNKKI